MFGFIFIFALICAGVVQEGTCSNVENNLYNSPFVIRKSGVLKKWNIFQNDGDHEDTSIWTLLPKELNHTYVSNTNTFPYYDRVILKDLKGFPAEYSFETVKLESFLNPDEEPSYYYYSGNIMLDGFKKIVQNVKANELFDDINSLPQLTANIWISKAEVHATLHYDAVYNLFIQLDGRKKVILRPPRDIISSAMYGRNHPYACQSRWKDSRKQQIFTQRQPYSLKHQQNISHDSSSCSPISFIETYNSILSGDPSHSSLNYVNHTIEVILEPMDVLFIPPFWLHETEALDSSVSLSFWWESNVTMQWQDWLESPLPIEENWSGERIQTAVHVYLNHVIEAFTTELTQHLQPPVLPLSAADIMSMIKHLLQLRYVEDLECSYVIEHSSDDHEDEFDTDYTPTKKIKRYASTLAKNMINQFIMMQRKNDQKIIHDEVFKLPEKVERKSFNRDSKQCDSSTNDEVCRIYRDDENNDAVTVVLVKVCDYIEEVFTFIAQYLIHEQPSIYSDHSKVC